MSFADIPIAARWQWRMPIWQWGERLRAFATLALQHIRAKPHLSYQNRTHETASNFFWTRRLTRKHAIAMAEWFVRESWDSPAVCPCRTLLKGGNIKTTVQPTCRFGKARFARWLPICLLDWIAKRPRQARMAHEKEKPQRNFQVWTDI